MIRFCVRCARLSVGGSIFVLLQLFTKGFSLSYRKELWEVKPEYSLEVSGLEM